MGAGLKTRCPHCSATYLVAGTSDKTVGKLVACRKCKKHFPITPLSRGKSVVKEFEDRLDAFMSDFAQREVDRASGQVEADHSASTESPGLQQEEPPEKSRPSEEPHSRSQVRAGEVPPKSGVTSDRSGDQRQQAGESYPETPRADTTSAHNRYRLVVLCSLLICVPLLLAILAQFFWPGESPEQAATLDRNEYERQVAPFADAQGGKAGVPSQEVDDAVFSEPLAYDLQPVKTPTPQAVFGQEKTPLTSPETSRQTGREERPRPAEATIPPRQAASPEIADRPVGGRHQPTDEESPRGSPPRQQEAVEEIAKPSVALIEHPLGMGTGFVVAENILATNAHVVEGGFTEELLVRFPSAGDEPVHVARVVYEDGARDLCLIEVQTDRAPIPTAGNYRFRQGDEVTIIGNPSIGRDQGMILRNAVTKGKVEAVVQIDSFQFYHIDASVNPGSSGGPVLDTEGRAIAVVAMKATDQAVPHIQQALRRLHDGFADQLRGATGRGIAYGIPANTLDEALQRVREGAASELDRRNDEHDAKALLRRLSVLGAIHSLQMLANAPPDLQREQNQLLHLLAQREQRQRRDPSGSNRRRLPSRDELVELPPPHIVNELRAAFESEEMGAFRASHSMGIQGNLQRLLHSEHLEDTVKRGLQSMVSRVKKAESYADDPKGNYVTYSSTVLGFQNDLMALVERLGDSLGASASVLDKGHSQ